MKKIICGLILILSLTIFKELSVSKKIIPDDAIRLRVLANSNSSYDQNVKEKVKTQLQSEVYTHLKDAANIDDARDIIKANIGNFDKSIKKVMEKENYNIGYNIDFGYHYFPNKEYKGIEYDEGYYESILVKIGKGEGNNWWCVLFPPLCLLEAEESTEVEYKFFVQEIIDKFLK
ncbi:MAG TPA: stage II sporulation protein R [Mollicutes bacterium]|jgi:stage II sporulation protein R|nr:stage II sporulation protein R [Mollicutes bacterium]